MHNQRPFTQLPAPARPPFTINLSAAQSMRASSNPEYSQPQPQGGPLRHLPGPPGQYLAPQGRLPLKRLTPSTEVLEHVHPGSTSRGDFHSDPTAHNAMDSYNSESPNNYVAVPSRGFPGPFTYRRLPPPTQPVPLLSRVGTFGGNVPKGKKNPKKKSSDDARIMSNAGNGSRQVSNGTNPKRPFALQDVQLPFYSQSPDAIPLAQDLRPSLGAVPYSDNYHQPNLPPGHSSGNRQETFPYTPYHGQTPMLAAIEARSRVVSNPYSPSAHELQGPTQDPRPTVLTLPIPTHVQHQEATSKGKVFEKNAGFVPTQMQPHISQPLDPHAFGHQLPDRRIDAKDRQDPNPELQRLALASMSNADQPPIPGAPGCSKANDTPRRPVQEGCTIWIGGLPNEFDKAAVMHLLRPCRALVDVSEPRVSLQSKDPMNRSYAFAEYVIPVSKIVRNTNLNNHSFQNPVDAAEALERLPQTRFASLPEGTFLSTNYPRPKLYSSPGRHQCGSDGDSKRPASNVSPTKSCNGEDPNRAGKSKNEHGRKPSKGSARGKKQSTSSSEGNSGRLSQRVMAMDAGQKASGLQPEEAFAIPDPHDKAESMVHLSQPSADDRKDSKPMKQDPAAVQPHVGVETYANQDSKITGDRAQEIASAPSAQPQVQESHQAPGSRYTEGRAKAPKKKSKGSNRLPVPEIKGSEPPTARFASGSSKPIALAKPSASDTNKILKNLSHLEDREKQGGSEIEVSKMAAPTVPLEPTSTLLKVETPDQSFLGRRPTEDDGEQQKASVAHFTKPSSAKDNEAEVSKTAPVSGDSAMSAAPLEQPEEPMSQAMRRDVSSSTQGSADTAPSILSPTVPPSSSQTERSNSITEETLSTMIQATYLPSEAALFPEVSKSVETAMEQKAETTTGLAPSGTGRDTTRVQEELRTLTNGELGGFRLGLIEENPEQTPCMSLIQPSPSKSDRTFSRSPARKRAPSIPPRSSSLAAPSTPIKTHQKKKKPRNFTPVEEAPSGDDLSSPSKVTGPAVEGTKMDSSAQTTGSTKTTPPISTINPAACTLTTNKSKDLPKPETPFLMDDGVTMAPPKISRQIVMEASNADRYYAQKKNYQVFHLGNAMHINAIFNSLDSLGSTSPQSSERSTPDHASARKQNNDLETTLREAGFRSLSDTSPFTIKDPRLALLETMHEEGNPLKKCTNKDGPVLSWIDDTGKLGPGMSFNAWTKQNEMMEIVKKAAAVKRLLAGSPPWTQIESQREQLLQIITHFFSNAQEQQTAKSKAQGILWAKTLLDTTPQRDSSTSEMQKWSRNVSHFMEENASEPTPAYAQSRKRTTNNPSKTSRDTPSREQQQERRHPVLMNKPVPQTLARKLGRDEDAFHIADIELNDSLTSGQSTELEPSPSTFGHRTPSEERPTPSVALIPTAALNRVSKLKDLFVEMGKDRRSWSDDRHRVSTPPQGAERMTSSDPGIKPLGAEFDVRRVTEAKDVESEPRVKETENEVQQKPHEDKQSESKAKELGSEDGKRDQNVTVKSDGRKDPTPAESKQNAPEKAENPTHQRQTSQSPGVSFSSFDGNVTTSNEGSSEEAQRNQPRGGHSPLMRSGYSAVAGQGTDGKRGGKKEGRKDPWALPQGEKPWGSGGEGRGEKKKRQRQ